MEITDYKTRIDRIGLYEKEKLGIMLVIILLIGIIFATQFQNYIQSFYKTRNQALTEYRQVSFNRI